MQILLMNLSKLSIPDYKKKKKKKKKNEMDTKIQK